MGTHKFTLPAGLLLFFLLLSGCSVKFTYNQLDWLIPWYLDDYVSLNSDQEALFTVRLEENLNWHREQQLPVYADFLEWLASASEDGLSESELDKIQRELEAFVDQLNARLAPVSLDLFASLDDAQVRQLFNNLERENEEFVEKYVAMDEQKQRHKRIKEMRKFIERWTGELDEAQIELIRLWSQQYVVMGEEFIQSRLAWQRHLKQLLMRRNESDYLQQSLIVLFANRRRDQSVQYTEKLKQNAQLLKQLELKLNRSLTTLQRRQLIGKLNSYAQDFRELSKDQ